jgi:hypothetical protein
VVSVDPKAAWLERVLEIVPATSGVASKPTAHEGGSGTAARPGGGASVASSASASLDPDKLQNQLAMILLKIGDYAEGAKQEQDWLDRATKAQELIDDGDTKGADALIAALGKEMMAAAERARAAYAPFARWQKAYDGCLTQADGLRAAMVKQISDADQAIMPEFESGWATFEDELSGVGEVVEKALTKARRAPEGDRKTLVVKAVAAATKMIDTSSLLSDIDENDVQPVSIVGTLRQELDALRRAAGG